MYERLGFMGVKRSALPDESLAKIEHGDDERQLGWARQKQMLSIANGLYRLAKNDISLLAGRVPPLEERLALRAQIDKMVRKYFDQEIAEQMVLKINLEFGHKRQVDGWLKRQLLYSLKYPDADALQTEPEGPCASG